MRTVNVFEIFDSIQGESTYSGLPCFFVRLAGCNLRCGYCDTRYAWKNGRNTQIADIVRKSRASRAVIAEITGGEPLLQEGFPQLAKALRDRSGKKVLVETNGSLNISLVPADVIAIMDIKCPGSGECEAFDRGNIDRLRPYDEVKFVLNGSPDYTWARNFVEKHRLAKHCHAILFSPVQGKIAPMKLAGWIVRDGLPVRMQVQLHKLARIK